MTAPKPEGFTAGPWVVGFDDGSGERYILAGPACAPITVVSGSYSDWGIPQGVLRPEDAARIVYAHNTIDTAIAERDAAIARVDRLEAALWELVEVCESDFTSEHTESLHKYDDECEPDDEPVAAGDIETKLTFGHIRRGRSALSAAKAGGAG